MLRHLPKFSFNGLTIVMSNPSRLDRSELLSGPAGFFFNEECLRPETNIHCCDVRLIDDKSPLYKGTKVILLLGAKAFAQYARSASSVLSLDEGRGSPYIVDGIPCIASFAPQDAVDMKDFESKLNVNLLTTESEETNSDEIEAGEIIESKGRGRTARSNYRFWLKNDTKKALRILNNDGVIPEQYEPNYFISPDLCFIVDLFNSKRNDVCFFDMETDFNSMDMRCFAVSFLSESTKIYCIPTLNIDYTPYYGEQQHLLWKALAICIRNNILVAHNGSQFDFFVLAYKYKIPIDKVYDTMISAHRIHPTIEKSLGHLVSLYTYEPYHKNEGVHSYRTREQANKLYTYCAKDVFTMYLVWKAQQNLMSKDEGLKRSVEQGNDAIKPYLTSTILGVKYNEEKRQSLISKDDKLMMQYLRIMQSLMGPDVEPLISNKKTVKYFHTMLGYDVVLKTPKGEPSLKEQALYKLALRRDNPVIKFLIKYRGVQKEVGSLNFNPWIK